MNDWPYKKFIIVVAVIQTSLIATILMNFVGISIPFLREFLGFIYLTLVPGLLILRILKIHEIGSIETFLFSIGLSLSVVMFFGFFIDLVFPFFGIKGPISLFYLIISFTFLILFLGIVSFITDRKFSSPSLIDTEQFISNQFLFLITLPLLAFLGTYLMNNYQINYISIMLIILIGLVALFVAFDKIPKFLYPFSIFIISISLLFDSTLISNYITGYDINVEFYVVNSVVNNHWWNYTLMGSDVSSMLSITILAPIYSLISGINVISLFKVIYPFIFSLVPVGLYVVFQKQTNKKIAFFSSFLFMSFFSYYFDITQLARQEIAELFFVLIIMLILIKEKKFSKSLLLVLFTFSLIVSHYGLSYIFMLMLISAFIILYLANFNLKLKKEMIFVKNNFRVTYLSFIILYVVFLLAWYINVSGSTTFESVITIANHISGSIFTDFFNPTSTQGLALVQSASNSILHTFGKYVQIAVQIFIVLGILSVLFKKIKFNINNEFLIYAFTSLLILICGLIVPFFSSSLNTSRLYQISLFFLAPFGVIGFIVIFKYLGGYLRLRLSTETILKVFSVFLILFLFINSGLLYQIFNDNPSSLALTNNPQYPKFNDLEVNGVNWLYNYKNKTSGDSYGDVKLSYLIYGYDSRGAGILNNKPELKGTYISLGTNNILTNKILLRTGDYTTINNDILGNKIYDNGGYKTYIS